MRPDFASLFPIDQFRPFIENHLQHDPNDALATEQCDQTYRRLVARRFRPAVQQMFRQLRAAGCLAPVTQPSAHSLPIVELWNQVALPSSSWRRRRLESTLAAQFEHSFLVRHIMDVSRAVRDACDPSQVDVAVARGYAALVAEMNAGTFARPWALIEAFCRHSGARMDVHLRGWRLTLGYQPVGAVADNDASASAARTAGVSR